MTDDLAPWEHGSARFQARKSDRQSAVPDAPYTMPSDDKLPDVLKPDGGGMVASGEITVPRPPVSTPRAPQPKAKMAMTALLGLIAAGLATAVLPFVVISEPLAWMRSVFAVLGGVMTFAGVCVYAVESARLTRFRNLTFFPAVLCYGSSANFQKYAGPAGLAGISASRIRGSGKGILNLVFDQSAHLAAPPEVVALLLDRGAGPELVGVDWEAVRQCQRGDIVWYHATAPNNFIFFHLMVPFAPAVSADKATREEVFRALKVGKSMFKDFQKREAASAAMSKSTKVIKTDASGNIIAASDDAGSAEFVESTKPGSAPQLKLSALGSNLGGAQQPEQAPDAEQPGSGRKPKYDALSAATEYSPPPKEVGKYRIADPNKPLGAHGAQDQSGEL